MDLTRNFRGKLFGKRGEELNNTPHTGNGDAFLNQPSPPGTGN